MLKLTSQQKQEFAAAVEKAGGSDLLAGVDEIYRMFEAERQVRQPICRQSGECCRFEAYGHRLFVSVMEMARFRQGLERGQDTSTWDGTGCPFQAGGRCTVHAVRPFGCRVYFCDPTSTQWQNDQYEQLHRKIRELHELAGVPYLYIEWREALDAVGVSAREPTVGRKSLVVLE